MSADRLLPLLDKVRRTGAGRWLACCPAHTDRSPSLSVREMDDGRILIHCFSGCGVEEVLSAVSMAFTDLYPARPLGLAKSERRPFLPTDIFTIARFEIGVVAIIAADMHNAKVLTVADHDRLFTAAERLDAIARAAYGSR